MSISYKEILSAEFIFLTDFAGFSKGAQFLEEKMYSSKSIFFPWRVNCVWKNYILQKIKALQALEAWAS